MPEMIFWDLFFRTVEGQIGPASSHLVNGKPAFSSKPITSRDIPNLELLAEFFRSEEPVPRELRLWLADLLDPQSDSQIFRIRIVKSKTGRPEKPLSSNWEAANAYRNLLENGIKVKQALYKIKMEYNISRNTLLSALKSLEDSEKIHSQT